MEKKLEIMSDISKIQEVERLVDETLGDMDVAKAIYGNVLISVTEAVNNSIIHGNKLDKNKKVNILVNRDKDFICFVIEDEGTGFNYEDIPDPTSPENIQSLNGRGIFLMKQLSDEIEFRENGKIVEMKFKIN
jgi:serine/threonine-protein kinase RsbW